MEQEYIYSALLAEEAEPIKAELEELLSKYSVALSLFPYIDTTGAIKARADIVKKVLKEVKPVETVVPEVVKPE